MAGNETIERTVEVSEDCTLPYDGGSGHRYVVVLKKGDEVRVTRRIEPIIPEVVARRFREGETFYCGRPDCPGYTFAPNEPSHIDPAQPGRCAADTQQLSERTKRASLETIPIKLENVGGIL
ncbi:MAG: hypothetical protein WC565_07030 [Parcubacteria group bacterium]